jgi:hypothetical protein
MSRILIAAVALWTLAAAPAAEASEGWQPKGHDSAVAACINLNGYKPAELVEAVEDGLGDWFVWVKDKDEDLWLCNANENGEVYANVLLNGDLLSGDGAAVITEDVSHAGPATKAEKLCAAVGGYMEDLEIVATVDDALGDYVVWLKNGDDSYWMCNASADSKRYSFEAVEYPLDQAAGTDDETCCATSEERQT